MLFLANSDAAIIRQVLAGNRDRFAVLVNRYQPVVYGVAYAQTGNRTDAEDIVQDAFLKSYENLHSLRETAKFGAWLVRIVRNKCQDLLEKRRRETTLPAEDELPAALPDVTRAEAHDILWKHIFKLDPEDREILLLYYFAAKNTNQIAELAGISIEAARKRLQRARATLGQELEQSLGAQLRPPHPDQSLRRIMAVLPPALYATKASAGAGGVLAAGLWGKVAAVGVLIMLASGTVWWNKARDIQPANAGTEVLAAGVVTGTAGISSARPVDPMFQLAALPALAENAPKGGSPVAQLTAALEGVRVPEGAMLHKLRGHVKDAQGRPVSGAEVRLSTRWMQLEALFTTPVQEQSTQSATDGSFFFENLKTGRQNRGDYHVLARKDNLAGIITHIAYGSYPTGTSDDIMLSPVESISGSVHDLSGAPLAGVSVYPFKHASHKSHNSYAAMGAAQTDKDGRFQLDDLTPGEWEILAWAPGYAAARAGSVNTGKNGLDLVLLPAKGALHGRVVDHDTGTPLEKVSLLIVRQGEKNFPWCARAVATDAQGQYAAEGLEEGPYTVQPLPAEGNPYLLAGEAANVDLGPGGTAAAPDLKLVRGAEISGRIFDPENWQGVAGVYVHADADSGDLRFASLHSDQNGHYTITGIVPGTYRLYTRGNFNLPTLTVAEQEEVTGKDIPYNHAGAVHGIVVDAQGNPVVGATVTATGGQEIFGAPVLSGSDGQFTVGSIAFRDRITLQATLDDLASAPTGPIKVERTPGESVQLTLTEPLSGRIAGRAFDARGNAMSGAQIAYWSPALVLGTRTSAVKADVQGHFQIDGLQAGTYQLQIIPAGVVGHTQMAHAEATLTQGQKLAGLEIRMPGTAGGAAGPQPELTISGRVTDTSGVPLTGIRVEARTDVGDAEVLTDASGRYTLSHLADDEYYLIIEQLGYNKDRKRSIRAGSSGVDFQLHANATVSGRVVDITTEKPLPGARIVEFRGNYIPTDPLLAFRRDEGVRTGSDGAFRVEHVKSGTVALLVSVENFAPAILTFNDLREREVRENVVIKLSAGGCADFSVRDANGQPIAGAEIHAGTAANYGPITNIPGMSRSDEQGIAKVTCLPVGMHWFTVTANNHAPARVSVNIAAAQDSKQLNVTLPAGVAIHGIVTLDGEPTANGNVWLKYVGQDDMPRTGAHLATDGTYEIGNVLPGRIEVGASFVGSDSRENTVSRILDIGDAGPLECNLDFITGTAAIEGHVYKNGEPTKQESVTLEIELHGQVRQIQTWPRSDGYYSISGLPDGPAVLRTGSLGHARAMQTVNLVPGQTIEQDLQIEGNRLLHFNFANAPKDWQVRLFLLKQESNLEQLPPADMADLENQAVRILGFHPNTFTESQMGDLPPGQYHLLGVSVPQWTSDGLKEAVTSSIPVEVLDNEDNQTVTLTF